MRANSVWILTGSDADGAAIGQLVLLLSGDELEIGVYSFDAARPRDEREKHLPPKTSAAIAIFTEVTIEDAEFLRSVEWCTERLRKRDDFRLFVHFDGKDPGALLQRVKSATAGPLRSVWDVVNIHDGVDIGALATEVLTYLRRLPEIRWRARFERCRDWCVYAGGALATGIQALSATLAIAVGAASLALGAPEVAHWCVERSRDGMTVIFGILAYPLFTMPVICLSRSPTAADAMWTRGRKAILWLTLMLAYLPLSAFMVKAGIPNSLAIPCIVFGAAADIVRRCGIRARWRLRLAGGFDFTPDGALPAPSSDQSGSPFQCPMLSPPWPFVFISYTRSSAWSAGQAGELYRLLETTPCRVFLDRDFIKHGTNWRRELQRHIARSNVLISVLDPVGAGREWPARELESALWGCRRIGSPQILVMVGKGESADEATGDVLPVFVSILGQKRSPYREGRPRVILVREGEGVKYPTLPVVASGLGDGEYRSESVLPMGCSEFMEDMSPVLLLAGLGLSLSSIAVMAVLYGLAWAGKVPPQGIAGSPLMSLGACLAGYGIGAALRAGVSAPWEWPTRSVMVRRFGLLCAIAGWFLLRHFLLHAAFMNWLWASVGGVAGLGLVDRAAVQSTEQRDEQSRFLAQWEATLSRTGRKS